MHSNHPQAKDWFWSVRLFELPDKNFFWQPQYLYKIYKTFYTAFIKNKFLIIHLN